MTVTSDSCLGGGGSGDWPPGFRFHPTDEELVLYYLKRKICKRRLKLSIIGELDVYKWDPEELPGQSILKTGDRQWFFFSPRDRKYPNAARSNRATRLGYWKATGKDRNIMCNSRTVGLKKTLVFYRGRAPSGERTDWVMHEYTLDEEELKRCPNVKDYFALYKVYKKSGPGPKNGEQYGAPFREEDWADDDYAEVNGHITHAIPVNQQIEVTPVDNIKIIGEAVPPLSDLEEIMKQITDEPLFNQPLLNDYTSVLPQVTGDEETQSTLVDPSTRETSFPEPIKLPLPIDQWSDQQANFDFDRSAISTLPSHDVPEVAFAPDSDPGLQTCEEDFLEMDDLLGPEPTCFNFEGCIHNSQFDDLNGLCEFDLFQDAEMFLRDMGPVVQDTVSNPYLSPLGNCSVNHVDYQLQHHSIANQGDDNLQTHLVADHVDYQLQEQFFGADLMSNNQLCVNVPRRDVMNSSDSNQTFTQPASGAVCETTNHPTEANENQSSNESNGTSGWFSSTLWSLVDSIPTTPASASESPVNKALVRMSSFSRVRMNAKKINADANIGAANVRRGGGNKGVIFLSVFGALCAILWLFVGTVRVLGRSISW